MCYKRLCETSHRTENTSINLPIVEEYLHVNIQVFTFSSVFNVSISKPAIVISMQPYKFKALFFQVTLTFLD